jgi:hypothetical protein
MPYIVSKINIRLDIPKKMRGIFPNEERLIIDLVAGEPKKVPDYVAKYYTSNRPHVYRYADKQFEEEPKENIPTKSEDNFNPVSFLELNYAQIDEALKQLPRKNVLAVAVTLKLTGVHKQKTDRVIERIVQDIEVKNKQNEELAKHKGVS